MIQICEAKVTFVNELVPLLWVADVCHCEYFVGAAAVAASSVVHHTQAHDSGGMWLQFGIVAEGVEDALSLMLKDVNAAIVQTDAEQVAFDAPVDFACLYRKGFDPSSLL